MDPRDSAIIHEDYPPCSSEQAASEGLFGHRTGRIFVTPADTSRKIWPETFTGSALSAQISFS